MHFAAREDLVRTLAVAPPRGTGRVRLVRVADVDLQACGGTHVAQHARDRVDRRAEGREQGQAEPARDDRVRGLAG